MTNKRILRMSEHRGWGGRALDYAKYAELFRTGKPHQFGEITSMIFAADMMDNVIKAKFHHYTEAAGNVHVLDGGTDTYEWSLGSDDTILYTVTELVETDANFRAGLGKSTFRIGLDVDYLAEPELIKSDDDNVPLGIIRGRGIPSAKAGSYIYTIELQTSDNGDYWPIELISVNAQFNRAATMIADELNQKYGGVEMSNGSSLHGQVGQVGNKFEFTDKALRTEIANKGKGNNKGRLSGGGKAVDNPFSRYYLVEGVSSKFDSQKGRRVAAGMVMMHAEYAIAERCVLDREYMMEYGRLQTTHDSDSGYTIKVAAGWRQLVLDGHYWVHSGGLTMNDIFDYLHSIFFNRRGFANRHVVLSTGTGGTRMISGLFLKEAGFYNHPDANFYIRSRKGKGSGLHEYELEGGAQFTAWRFENGISVELRHDPAKDDTRTFRKKAPGSEYPVESFCIDIFDLGHSDDADKNSNGKNLTMIKQDNVDNYFCVSNVFDPVNGVSMSKTVHANNSKEVGLYMELSGSLCIWDVTRIGRIEYRPYAS